MKRELLPPSVSLDLARDREKVREAKRPVINAGNGIRIGKAFDVFQRVVEMLGIPVVTGWNSLDCMRTTPIPMWAGRAIWAIVPETLPYRTVIFSCPWEAVFPSARWATITRPGHGKPM